MLLTAFRFAQESRVIEKVLFPGYNTPMSPEEENHANLQPGNDA